MSKRAAARARAEAVSAATDRDLRNLLDAQEQRALVNFEESYDLFRDPETGMYHLKEIKMPSRKDLIEIHGFTDEEINRFTLYSDDQIRGLINLARYSVDEIPVSPLDFESGDASPALRGALKKLLLFEEGIDDAGQLVLKGDPELVGRSNSLSQGGTNLEREKVGGPRSVEQQGRAVRVLIGDKERGFDVVDGSFFGNTFYVKAKGGMFKPIKVRHSQDVGHRMPFDTHPQLMHDADNLRVQLMGPNRAAKAATDDYSIGQMVFNRLKAAEKKGGVNVDHLRGEIERERDKLRSIAPRYQSAVFDEMLDGEIYVSRHYPQEEDYYFGGKPILRE